MESRIFDCDAGREKTFWGEDIWILGTGGGVGRGCGCGRRSRGLGEKGVYPPLRDYMRGGLPPW